MKALVVEEAHVGEGHGDVVFVTSLNDIVVTDRATGLCNLSHATLVRTLDVVAEGEESIRAETYVRVLGNPLFLLRAEERLRLLREPLLPGSIAQHILILL